MNSASAIPVIFAPLPTEILLLLYRSLARPEAVGSPTKQSIASRISSICVRPVVAARDLS